MGLSGLFNKKEKKLMKSLAEDKSEPDEETTYEMNYECDNCESEEMYEIPIGIKWNDYIKGKKCENCGCLLFEEEVK